MSDNPRIAPIVIVCLWIGATAQAQGITCNAAPPPPANAAASVTTAGTADLPAVVTVQWVAVPTQGANAVTTYVIEVGDAPGVTNIAEINTGGPAVSDLQTATNGTYYVRVRSANACGKSARSPEPVVVVTDAAPPGAPAARRVVGFFGEDLFGDVTVIGEVRGAWGAQPAPLVRIDSQFLRADGSLIDTGFAYAYGHPRRVATTRLVDDASLAPGESGCYVIVTNIPYRQVARVTSATSWGTVALEPLKGNMVIQDIQGRHFRTLVGCR